ncbi:MAG: C40 family peptidase [Firmicutes bacterium]|nr:C40 family peptidase [Bacillota bacterium]
MKHGFVTANVANLHRNPDALSEVVTQARMGEGFRVLDAGADWLHISLDYDAYEGYIEARRTRDGHWPAQKAVGVTGVAAIRNLFANIYVGPKVQRPLQTVLPMGVRLPVLRRAEGAEEGWLVVGLADGREGFAQAADLSAGGREWAWSTPAQLRQSLVRTARRFLGIPYRWGGASSFGLDCSGLVQYVYYLHGLILPRDANQQAESGRTRRIPREELVPGDLIFFAKYGHVGMAISHHEFIHATTHLDPVVQISAVDDQHWVERTDEIRRYILD